MLFRIEYTVVFNGLTARSLSVVSIADKSLNFMNSKIMKTLGIESVDDTFVLTDEASLPHARAHTLSPSRASTTILQHGLI